MHFNIFICSPKSQCQFFFLVRTLLSQQCRPSSVDVCCARAKLHLQHVYRDFCELGLNFFSLSMQIEAFFTQMGKSKLQQSLYGLCGGRGRKKRRTVSAKTERVHKHCPLEVFKPTYVCKYGRELMFYIVKLLLFLPFSLFTGLFLSLFHLFSSN